MPVSRFLGKTVRGLLARRGFALARLDPGAPVPLDAYLAALPRRGIAIGHVCVFDANPEPVKGFLAAFSPEQTTFHSGPGLENRSVTVPETGSLLLATDVESLTPDTEAWLTAPLRRAEVVIVRGQLHQFTTGTADALALVKRLAAENLVLADVLQTPSTAPLRSATANVFFAFERASGAPARRADQPRGRAYRVAEALSHLSSPLISATSLIPLAGRGSHGFAAGVMNPGAIRHDGRILLLPRGESLTWPQQKHNPAGFVRSCQPLLLSLAPDLSVRQADALTFTGTVSGDRTRFEDFRLFEHQRRIYSNHSMIELGGTEPVVRPERLRTSIGISQLDPAAGRLTHLGSPRLGRATNRVEKNWAMFSAHDAVHLIYSFQPYRLYSAPQFPALEFEPRHTVPLALPVPDDGLPLRNSINPVPYDDVHLLHVVHKVYPGKHYVFWAVLIDRRTLLPVRMIPRPLLRAGGSAAAAIVYACSAIVHATEVVVFAGLDDCATAAWRIARCALDGHWVPIDCMPALPKKP